MLYISRPQTEAFLSKVAEAVQQPGTQPIVFQVSGIGGVGKSILLAKLKETQKQTQVVQVSFGETEGIDDPIQLMRKLHEKLEKQYPIPKGLNKDVRDVLSKPDPFSKLYEQFWDTSHQLRTQSVDGKASVSDEQLKIVKQVVKGVMSFGGDLVFPGVASNILDKAAEPLVDAGIMLLSEKDRLLQQHPATRGKRSLQELMANPVPKLTQAFTESLVLRSKKRPIILILDTYEKAQPDIDSWLWQSLLLSTELQPHPIRLVVAGRYPLTRALEWHKLRDRELLWEQSLKRFDWKQTEQYLQKIGITSPDQVMAICQRTKGLPKYLSWVKRKHEANQEFDFSQAGQEIEDWLLEGLSKAEKQVVRQAACCNWFDQRAIQRLLSSQEDRDWFEWLKQQHFVEFAQRRYRFDDVARDVFRQALWDNDRRQFQQTHTTLARYFEAEANQEVTLESPPSVKYKNSDWRGYRSEFLYHALFARLLDVKPQVITHLLESQYFQEDVFSASRENLHIDTELSQFLGQDLKAFLDSIYEVLFRYPPLDRNILEGKEFRQVCPPESFPFWKSEVETCVKICFKTLDKLEGLAKFAALLYQSQWCPSSQQLDWLHQAKQQAETIATNSEPEYSSGLFLRIGHRFDKVGKPEEAVAAYDQALEIDPDNRYALLGKAFVLSCDLNQHEKVIPIFDRILDINPNDDEAWRLKGFEFIQLRRSEDAINSFDQAIAINPDCQQAFFWFYRGLELRSSERYEDAVDSFDRGIQIEPDNGSYWYFHGVALSSLKRYEEAIISYDKAIAIDSNDDSAWLQKSFVLSQLGRYEKALIGYDKAIAIDPNNHRAWFQRFSVLFQLGRYQEATDSYKRVLDINPNDPDIPRMPKEVLEAPESVREIVRNWQEFLESCDRNLEIKPDDADMWFGRGIVLNFLGRHEQAIASFDRALTIDPDYLEAWNLRRLVPGGLGREAEALASYDRALAVNPKNPQVLYYQGCALASLKRHEAALSTFDDVLKLDRDHHKAWSERGDVLEKLGRREDAIESYKRVLAIDPNQFPIWNTLGFLLDSLGRAEEAVASYDKALEIAPHIAEIWIRRGIALGSLKRYEDAIASCDRAIALEADHSEAHRYRGKALLYLARYEEAIASLDKAIAIRPNYHAAWSELGFALRGLERFEDAIESFDRSIAINPADYKTWSVRGFVLQRLQRFEEAIASFDQAIAIKPALQEADFWSQRGATLLMLNRLEEAIDSYDKSLQVDPDNYGVWYWRGFALSSLERYEEAVTSYDRVIAINPNNHKAWYQKFMALTQLGRTVAAALCWKRALDIKPDLPPIPENVLEALRDLRNHLEEADNPEELLRELGETGEMESLMSFLEEINEQAD